MRTDEQLAEQVGRWLHAEVADIRSAPDLTSTLRRRQARRARVLTAAVAVPVVAAGVATAVVVTSTGTGRPGAPLVASTGPQRVQDVGYVTARAAAALDAAANYVMHSHESYPGGSGDTWFDQATGRLRTDSYRTDRGRVYSTTLSGPLTGQVTEVTVDYADRAWWSEVVRPRPGNSGAQQGGMFAQPDEIRDSLRRGSLRLVDRGQVSGHDAIHLQATDLPKDLPGAALDIWVDATSYLPLRVVVNKGKAVSTIDYTWLDRNGQNLALLDLTPPAGFTHRSGPVPPSGPAHG